MNEITHSKRSFRERQVDFVEKLRKKPIVSVAELAATIPGGYLDVPFAPIDPALNVAAQQVMRGDKPEEATCPLQGE